jgi:virginiamycin A acetyltransferase
VPPYGVVVGNPGRLVKKRFDDATIDRLLGVAWWHWPIDKLTRNLDAITNADLDALENAV